MTTSTLKIMLWDKEVGRLFWDTRRGVSFFEYHPAFLGGSLDPFPLMASVKSAASHRPRYDRGHGHHRPRYDKHHGRPGKHDKHDRGYGRPGKHDKHDKHDRD